MNTVLVVDDALTIRQYHKSILEEIGLQVIEAENGIEAMEMVVQHPLSLCLVDVNMPVMDGYTFVSQLRRGEDNADCPVIMITTESRPVEEAKGYEAGANIYLVKPADPERLKELCSLMVRPPVDDMARPPRGIDIETSAVSSEHAPMSPPTPAGHGLTDYLNELMSE